MKRFFLSAALSVLFAGCTTVVAEKTTPELPFGYTEEAIATGYSETVIFQDFGNTVKSVRYKNHEFLVFETNHSQWGSMFVVEVKDAEPGNAPGIDTAE